MPHLNELSEKYASEGLTVLALTSEGPEKTEHWIESKGAKYPYAYDKGGKLARGLGVRGIPAAVLVDPMGNVVWQGHPGGIKDAQIDALIHGALKKPVYTWPEDLSGARKAMVRGDLKKALEAAANSDSGQDSGVLAALEEMVNGRVAALKSAFDEGDMLTTHELAGRLSKELKGLPAADEVAAIKKALAKNREAKSIMKAQAKVRKLRDTPIGTRKDAAELLIKVEKLARKYDGNAAGREASAFADELREKL